MTDHVLLQIRDGVQTIRFNRPDKKNALTREMYDCITEALIAGDASDDIAVHVFLGSRGVFTAGNDIKDFAGYDGKARNPDTGASGLIRRLPVVAKPMIAAVDGVAIGIGATMLLHCDLVYASPAAILRTPFLDLGLVPEAGSSLLAPLRIGAQRAFELLCLGEAFDAQRACQAGMINQVVPADQLEAVAMDAAARLVKKPPRALAAARKLLRGETATILAQIERESELFTERLSSDEAREAFNAFLEKRAPDFSRFRRSA